MWTPVMFSSTRFIVAGATKPLISHCGQYQKTRT
jgi:hypothetical protein